MTVRLDRLLKFDRITNAQGTVSPDFQAKWQRVMEQIENALNSVIAAQEAADTANAAAVAATAAADVALTAADDATTAATDAAGLSALATSGVTGLILTATDAGANATVSISAHTRVYGDGTSVAVNAGSLTGLAYSTAYYIYYDDPSRAGGAVTYVASTTEANAAQTGDRHSVGAVTTPAALASPITGNNNRPPGVVEP